VDSATENADSAAMDPDTGISKEKSIAVGLGERTQLAIARLGLQSAAGSGSLLSSLRAGWSLKAAEFSFQISIRTPQTDLVQYHGDAGDLESLKKSRCAMQFLPGGRAGFDHKHSRIDQSRQILGVR
jgi:hypothetical protein